VLIFGARATALAIALEPASAPMYMLAAIVVLSAIGGDRGSVGCIEPLRFGPRAYCSSEMTIARSFGNRARK
jgi:hypothetical protein